MNESFAVLKCSELSAQNKPILSITKIPATQPILHEQLSPDPDAVDSAISSYFQCGPRSVRTDMLLELLCQVMDKAMFQQLRTQEQLGYIVNAGVQSRWGVCGLRCLIQSVHPPAFLEARLETFLEMFGGKLRELSDEDFAEHVNSLRTKKLEKDRSVDKLGDRLMIEVCSHEYVFDRKEQEAAALTALLKSDLVEFFERHLAASSPDRCKLSCHITGKQALEAARAEGGEPDVGPDSVNHVLVFEKGAVPFPAIKEGAEPPALPEPRAVPVDQFRGTAERLSVQK